MEIFPLKLAKFSQSVMGKSASFQPHLYSANIFFIENIRLVATVF